MSVTQELTAKFAQKIAELTGLKYAPKNHDNGHISHYLENPKGGKIGVTMGAWNENKCRLFVDNLYPVLIFDLMAYRTPKMTTQKNNMKLNQNDFPDLSFGFTVNAENWEKSAIRASKNEIFAKLSKYHQAYLAQVEKENQRAKNYETAYNLGQEFQKFPNVYPKVFSNSIEMTISVSPNDAEKIQDLRNFLEKWNKKETD